MTKWDARPLRCLLFAPGNNARMLEKVGSFGADAVVLDLEDAVPPRQKSAARVAIRGALPSYDPSTVIVVRVNATETGFLPDDLEAIVCERLDFVMLPKTDDPDTLVEIDRLLSEIEMAQGLPPESVHVLAVIETAKGIALCDEIARRAPSRVSTFVFGPADLAHDLEIDLTAQGSELLYARSKVIIAARAAGLKSPIDGAYLFNLRDLDGLAEDTRRSRQFGFQGRVVIHPSHVVEVQRVYSALSEEELSQARRVVESFDAAVAEGRGAIQVDGRMIDFPIYYRAKEKLALHERLETLDGHLASDT